MSGTTSLAHVVGGVLIRESRTLCTQRSVSGKEFDSSSSAMLGFSWKILEMRVGRRGLVPDCCWVGFAAWLDSSSRCLRPKRAVLLISLRKQQGFVRPFMSGCRHACSGGRKGAERRCPNSGSRMEGRRHTRRMFGQLRAVSAAWPRRLCVAPVGPTSTARGLFCRCGTQMFRKAVLAVCCRRALVASEFSFAVQGATVKGDPGWVVAFAVARVGGRSRGGG
jgi:hypothetical protein